MTTISYPKDTVLLKELLLMCLGWPQMLLISIMSLKEGLRENWAQRENKGKKIKNLMCLSYSLAEHISQIINLSEKNHIWAHSMGSLVWCSKLTETL